MTMINEQYVRSEVAYRIEQAHGRRSDWARVEGLRDLLHRRRRGLNGTGLVDGIDS